MIKQILFIIILGLPTTLFGLQKVPIQEGVETQIPISNKGLNHIVIENDRILTVKGSSGPFQLDKDEILGQLYIQTEIDAKDPIHLFLTTENQRTLSLSLIPKDIPQESITLVLEELKDLSFESSQPYEIVIANLMKAMVSGTPLEGYGVEVVQLKNKGPKGLKVWHLTSYRGERLRGEVLEICNSSKETVYLTEQDFYKSGVRAIALSSSAIVSGEKISVYLVRNNG